MRRLAYLALFLVMGLLFPLEGHTQGGGTRDLSGQWFGVGWHADDEFYTTAVDLYITESGGVGTAVFYVPEFGLFNSSFPLTVVGDEITIGDPSVLGFTGTIIDGNTIEGEAWESSILTATWYTAKDTGAVTYPGPAPGPSCDLPPLICTGGSDYCAELIPFEPVEGPGYLNYPMSGGETWEDQVFSYLRRDHIMLIKYATAKVACKTAEWDYGNFAPLGLGDMSEADGSTPGTMFGSPRHPPGTHENGNDIDTGYYQLFSPDNLLRSVGVHYLGTDDQYHLVEEPYALDRWRTALYIAYLSEHPDLRVVGVDGRIGVIMEGHLNALVTHGWIDEELRASIPLAYEVVDEGWGWYLFHHHHMHISMNQPTMDVPEQDETPLAAQLMGCYPNPFNPRTTVRFAMTQSQPVRLSIYDVTGRMVKRLVDGENMPAGVHEVPWDGCNNAGRRVLPGVYSLRFEAGSTREVGKVVFLK